MTLFIKNRNLHKYGRRERLKISHSASVFLTLGFFETDSDFQEESKSKVKSESDCEPGQFTSLN